MKQFKYYSAMQILNVIFSFSSVVVNLAAQSWRKDGFLNLHMVIYIGLYVVLMGVYAFFWQKVIKHVTLSSAYLCKALILFWTLIWSAFLFREQITFYNVMGTIVIFIGTILVTANE